MTYQNCHKGAHKQQRVTDNSAIYKHSRFIFFFGTTCLWKFKLNFSLLRTLWPVLFLYCVFILKQKRNVENIITQISLIKPSFITLVWCKKAENQCVNNTYCNREWFKERGRFLCFFSPSLHGYGCRAVAAERGSQNINQYVHIFYLNLTCSSSSTEWLHGLI